MPEPLPDFRRVLERLTAEDVRFVLVGGLAMVAHGSSHVTRDIDICYGREAQNLAALAGAIAPLHPTLRGAPADLPFRWDERTLRAGLNFTLLTDAGALDVLGQLAGVESFESLYAGTVALELFGLQVRVASLADLMAMKRAAGRPKDLLHLQELQRLALMQSE